MNNLFDMFKKINPISSNEKPNISLSFEQCPSIDYAKLTSYLKGVKIGSNAILK